MDPASLFGVLISFGMLFASLIVSGNPLNLYWDLGSFLLVIFGSFGATMLASDMGTVKNVGKILGKAFNKDKGNVQEYITQLVGFSESARKDGLLSLDDAIKDVEDPFLASGLRLVVDGTDPLIIQRIMGLELDKLDERHATGNTFFSTWAAMGPSFGMLGTVMGLIGMMANLSDTASIGRGMALALITTFYGSILSNMVMTPIAVKLSERHSQEMLAKDIMMEGILSIQAGDNPRILEQKLFSFLPPRERPIAKDIE